MKRELFRKINIALILFFAVSILSFFALNAGAYGKILRYSLFLRSSADADLREGDILSVRNVLESEAYAGRTVDVSSVAISGRGVYRLVIPKIDVNVPVVLPRSESKEAILASLEEGVGLYPGSASVGSVEGRSVILGHSSRASWYRGDYATVFALLSKLEAFDEFYIVGEGNKYTYRVFSNKVLSPSDTNAILETRPNSSEIDLITCYPVGSSSKRTLIQASLVNTENI